MKLCTQLIIDFIGNILNTPELKRLFSDVWIDKNSLLKLFTTVNKVNSNVNLREFTTKLNFVSDSKVHSLHRKKTWNISKRYYDNWYLITSTNKNVGMISRCCKRHIVDLFTSHSTLNEARNNTGIIEDMALNCSAEGNEKINETSTLSKDEDNHMDNNSSVEPKKVDGELLKLNSK